MRRREINAEICGYRFFFKSIMSFVWLSGVSSQHNAQLQAVMTHAAALGQVQGAQHPAITNIMSGKIFSFIFRQVKPLQGLSSVEHDNCIRSLYNCQTRYMVINNKITA